MWHFVPNFVVGVDLARCTNIWGEGRCRDGSCSRFKGGIEVVCCFNLEGFELARCSYFVGCG